MDVLALLQLLASTASTEGLECKTGSKLAKFKKSDLKLVTVAK